MTYLLRCLLLMSALLSVTGISNAKEPLRTVSTILPLGALVKTIGGKQVESHILIKNANSPHDYQLKPSDARALQQADLIVWIGEDLETFMIKPMENLSEKAHVVDFDNLVAPATKKHDMEEKHHLHHDEHKDHEDENDHDDDHHSAHHHHEHDPHIWLDPTKVIKMAQTITETLSKLDPENHALYAINFKSLQQHLVELDQEISEELTPVKSAGFMVFHDGYSHFTDHYGLNMVGSLTLAAHQSPGAKQIQVLRKRILDGQAACVFAEPQFPARTLNNVVEGTQAKLGYLDPLGVNLDQDDPRFYSNLMHAMARALVDCLNK